VCGVPAGMRFAEGNDRGTEIRLTPADVEASNQKIGAAYRDLVAMWSTGFEEIGEEFAAPRLLRFRTAARTACGTFGAGNAMYCPRSNAVYFDELFVAGLAKSAAAELGTDGDMVAIGVIAHEVGHAVAMQLGYSSPFTYENESVADCLAGAFAKRSRENGSLEKGDLEEAFFGMASAGDPTPEYTGNAHVDRRIKARAQLMGHGTREQRMANFRRGLDTGAGACLEEFR
jgi:uncharacterized protein